MADGDFTRVVATKKGEEGKTTTIKKQFYDRRKMTRIGVAGGQPRVCVTTAILLAEFMFMKKGQQVAGVVGKGRFSLVDFLPKF
jgi:hypothetical protein